MAKEAEVQDEEPLFTIVNEEEKPEEINDYSFTAEVDKAFSVEKLEELKKSILETKKNNEEAKNKAQLAAEKKKDAMDSFGAQAKLKIVSEKITGNKAVVVFTYVEKKKTKKDKLNLEKIGGVWKIVD